MAFSYLLSGQGAGGVGWEGSYGAWESYAAATCSCLGACWELAMGQKQREHVFNFCVHAYLMHVYLRIKFMDHRLYWLALADFVKQFSKMVVLIYTSSCSV